nr:DUF2196 domain-containing protein [Enterocloster clostridioformis]
MKKTVPIPLGIKVMLEDVQVGRVKE